MKYDFDMKVYAESKNNIVYHISKAISYFFFILVKVYISKYRGVRLGNLFFNKKSASLVKKGASLGKKCVTLGNLFFS